MREEARRTPRGRDRAESARAPVVAAWREIAEQVPDGLALIDGRGMFVQINTQGAVLCGDSPDALLGTLAPFSPGAGRVRSAAGGLFEDTGAEDVCTFLPPGGGYPREFAYRSRRWERDGTCAVISFRDVTLDLHRRRRVAAIARSAAKSASAGSVGATLDALAEEVLRTDALAGVQIMVLDGEGERLEIIGSAGFRYLPDFFERMMRCRERGADLRMVEALETGHPVVVPDRWRATKESPAWEPMHDYLLELDWECFVSVPLLVRGEVRGVLNAFCAPGQAVGREMVEFLLAMAEHAATAVDQAALLETEREFARREERRRLARDLHDSVVQQVFSVGMQARSLRVLGEREDTVPSSSVRRIAEEIGALSKAALADLRAMVHELAPDRAVRLGFSTAVRTLVETTGHRTGLDFDLVLGEEIDHLRSDVAEDAYRIVAEAVHNASKHADADRIRIRLHSTGEVLTMTIADDGRGIDLPQNSSGGHGMRSMRERAAQWGGEVTLTPGAEAGAVLRATVPLPIEQRGAALCWTERAPRPRSAP